MVGLTTAPEIKAEFERRQLLATCSIAVRQVPELAERTWNRFLHDDFGLQKKLKRRVIPRARTARACACTR
jgi:hypothetical protein